jgi:invasion protein IalB
MKPLAMDFLACKPRGLVSCNIPSRWNAMQRHARTSVIGLVVFASAVVNPITVALAGEPEIVALQHYGDWHLFCEKTDDGVMSNCTLVQNVSGATANDPEAWVKSSVDVTNSGDLILSLRFDQAIMTESGVALRIDDRQVGVASFFRCDLKYCKTSIELGTKSTMSEIGTMLQFGKQLLVDVRSSDRSGYRLSLGLDGIKEGISALYSRAASTQSALVAWRAGTAAAEAVAMKYNIEHNSLVGPFGLQDFGKSFFQIAAVDQNVINPENITNSQTSYAAMLAQSCFKDQPTIVGVEPNLTVRDTDKDKIKSLVDSAKKCGDRQYFIVYFDSGRSGISFDSQQDVSSTSRLGIRSSQAVQVERAIMAAGAPSGHVFLANGSGVNWVPPAPVANWAPSLDRALRQDPQ